MCKLAHVIRYTVLSQNFYFYCFRTMVIYNCETECSFVYLITLSYNWHLCCCLNCAGLSSFVNNPSESSEHIVVLLQYAAALVPKEKHGETPVYIMATAGLRLLDAR